MDFGIHMLTRGPGADPEAISAMARTGDELGFAYFTVNDHIAVPGDIASRYPYTETGEWPGASVGECLEQLSVLSFIAAVTRRIRLLTSVMVLPHRPPVLAAKTIATADVLSGGRVTLGVGVGWMREELAAIGAPPFAERGAVSDEYLRVFKELWTADKPAFEGRYSRFSDIAFLPRPVQKPHPPIWVGGESPVALRRTVALGDCWYPVGRNPRYPLDTAERYAAAAARLDVLAEAEGRDPADIGRAYVASWPHGGAPATTDDGERQLLTGDLDAVVGDIGRLGELGVGTLVLTFQDADLDGTLERMHRFAEEILPRFAG
ncbi:MAG: LLM class F420-dependent oxidoreductase [Alphaproteobacteria bacterium]|nr:LLM class F420-dependent oxidoreductase [Alphaproteobacteria bacterium]